MFPLSEEMRQGKAPNDVGPLRLILPLLSLREIPLRCEDGAFTGRFMEKSIDKGRETVG